MVETATLERLWARKGSTGSNPVVSSKKTKGSVREQLKRLVLKTKGGSTTIGSTYHRFLQIH